MRSEGTDLEIRYFQENVDPEIAERFIIRLPEGAIAISNSADDMIHIDCELHGTTSTIPTWKPIVRRHESILVLGSEASADVYTASIEIKVPARVKDLEVHSLKGEIDIRDCPVNVLAMTELGGIHIHGAHSVEASTVQGQITLINCGSISVRTIDGSIRCSKINGTINAETQGGDIQISRVKGNVVALTQTGDISVLRPEGRIRLITRTGDVELELGPVFGGGEVNTYNGDVNLMLEQANIDFRAETLSGHISSPDETIAPGSEPRRCAYKIGQGTKRLHVKSVLGDIELE